MIGAQNVPPSLRARPVIGPGRIWPSDPRRGQMARKAAHRQSAE